ncbi:DUF5610 domain-containing protein [Neptuniibacter sp. CAU 1671]|uniref:DUF5610 domain-containing protein n=1 Tax=Neptuniibacter sp. CAU 1671 TaxID=3032593 RepID=UPI0023DC00D3|nr:DUF5610 domain-containing protein [Neptuniibacter sp. CAU 1671]MDF2180874.1 DUF5610 domain-containing protein [Neptuniibacter sp. CAU 1671]
MSSLIFQRKVTHEFDLLQQVCQSTSNHVSQALILVYKTTLDEINELLCQELEERLLDNTLDAGWEPTAEMVADRLVNMAIEIFSFYLSAHPELNEDVVLERFMNQITEGVVQGVAEAREILDGVNSLDEETESQIDQAFDLTLEGLENFRESFSFDSIDPEEALFNELGDAEDYEGTLSLDEMMADY